ncbi:uncharacterized protein B0H18DRAFT_959583 [Fomitopsis serialis]|uniref:uncharacterized protein n=1 Tax=Fomitopsis serialis TaxID=139415 RepID=UPI0020072ECB|nr:uncharacterized protein B0H18DRAFT_959583 [Neoantrodia serialis]KAH9914845.1 hypothetical protein B0H18DRAFT_959583 [Neoantrodia serialis]
MYRVLWLLVVGQDRWFVEQNCQILPQNYYHRSPWVAWVHGSDFGYPYPYPCIPIPMTHMGYPYPCNALVKVIFALPRKLPAVQGGGPAPPWWPRGPLAYVEWYTRFAPAADPSHLMYSVKKPPSSSNGLLQGKIIPLSQIRQSCQLTPIFPGGPRGTVPDSWSSENVLEMASTFYVNNWGGFSLLGLCSLDLPHHPVNLPPCLLSPPLQSSTCPPSFHLSAMSAGIRWLVVTPLGQVAPIISLSSLYPVQPGWCPLSHVCGTPQSLPVLQPDQADIVISQPYINAELPRDWEDGYIFLGGVHAWHRSVGFPLCLREEGKKAVVEVFLYYENFHGPMILPLMCRMYDNHIEFPFWQPVTEQALPCLNRWKRDPDVFPVLFKMFNAEQRKWLPIPSINELICIPLPLTNVIMIKYAQISATPWHHMYGFGIGPRASRPLSNLLARMYGLRYIWPTGFPLPRSQITLAPTIVTRGACNIRLLVTLSEGEPGYTMENVEGAETED